MTVELIVPDVAPAATPPAADAARFGDALNALGAVFDRANRSENAFASGNGNLVQAVYERAQADVALSVATAAAQRAAQALQTVLSMQV